LLFAVLSCCVNFQLNIDFLFFLIRNFRSFPNLLLHRDLRSWFFLLLVSSGLFIDTPLKVIGGASEFGKPFAERPGKIGELLRPDYDKRNDQYDDQFRHPYSKHLTTSLYDMAGRHGCSGRATPADFAGRRLFFRLEK
jgi:hypothetical protein